MSIYKSSYILVYITNGNMHSYHIIVLIKMCVLITMFTLLFILIMENCYFKFTATVEPRYNAVIRHHRQFRVIARTALY